MKCDNCGKIVPSSYDICPYCNHLIDRSKKEVDFGELNDTVIDDKFDIKVFVKEPKNKKYVIIGSCLLVFIVILFMFLIYSALTSGKTNYRDIYNNLVKDNIEYVIDNYLGNSAKKSGSYELDIYRNEKEYMFSGKYELDIQNKILNLNNIMEDVNKKGGGVIAELKELPFNINLNGNDLYISSKILGTDPVYFPYDDQIGLLKTKNYDLSLLLSGLEDALLAGIKQVNVTSGEEEIAYIGKKETFDYALIDFDNPTLIKFSDAFYDSLMEDSNFVNDIARIKNKKAEEIIDELDNYKTTNQYTYSGNTVEKISVKVYISHKEIKRISLTIGKTKYILDIGESKYYLEKYVDNKNVLSATLAYIEKETMDTINKTYEITYDTDEVIYDITLKLKTDKKIEVKKRVPESSKNVRDITDEELTHIKNALGYYINNVSWVDKFKKIFDNKCTPDLECSCEDNENVCSCNYNGTLINCDVDDIIKKSVEN